MARIFYFFFAVSYILLGSQAVYAGQQEYSEAYLQLVRGYKTYLDNTLPRTAPLYARLATEGQNPKIAIISCSDSRSIVELFTASDPGDVFVIRNAGNFVPLRGQGDSGVEASLEYAVKGLGVTDIIVCGHSQCGAIGALFDPSAQQKYPLLANWLKSGESAKARALKESPQNASAEEFLEVACQLSILEQLEHLQSYPFVEEALKKGNLKLHGWYFTVAKGTVAFYNAQERRFAPLASALDKQ